MHCGSMKMPLYANVAFIGAILFFLQARTTVATSVNLKVFTTSNPGSGLPVDERIIPHVFDGSRLTIFIVHGFMDGNSGWISQMKDAFLRKGDFNVIIVTWDAGRGLLDYIVTIRKMDDVGVEVAKVAAYLINNGGSHKSRLYCVGHSLGAHVCGHTGMRTKLGRITGLDPAGPMLRHLPKRLILNPSAADLVDVIHTDGDGLGTMRQLGHVDFYPNGGKLQPGCEWSYFRLDFKCSHMRVLDLYIASIEKPCFLSYNKCLIGLFWCPRSRTALQSMGFDSNNYSNRGRFTLRTSKSGDYCAKK